MTNYTCDRCGERVGLPRKAHPLKAEFAFADNDTPETIDISASFQRPARDGETPDLCRGCVVALLDDALSFERTDTYDPFDAAVTTLRELVKLIDAAGINNLANGVQLGPISWAVKVSDQMDAAKVVLAHFEEPKVSA